jgi:hypothetical protein
MRAEFFGPEGTTRNSPSILETMCYVSDLAKLRSHSPDWRLEYDLPQDRE